MATQIAPAVYGEVRQAGASKGVSLSTTAAHTILPGGTEKVQLIARNFSTAVVARYLLNPWLTVLKVPAATLGTAYTDYSLEAQDGSTATKIDLSALGADPSDALVIGCHVPFGGIQIDVDGANSNVVELDPNYFNGTQTSGLTETDGTASGGATLAQDGALTWTIPTDWTAVSLNAWGEVGRLKNLGIAETPLYWVVIYTGGELDAAVTLNSITAINRSTDYAELIADTPVELGVHVGPGGVSSLTAVTDAGTANLIVNCFARTRFA